MFKPYPSTDQFRHTIRQVINEHCGVYNEETDSWAIDPTVPKPKLTFRGTVKAHGTNMSVTVSGDGFVTSSRNNVITPENDVFGFSKWANSPDVKAAIRDLGYGSTEDVHITYYGEWCGGNIQKGVAISGLDKMWIIFAVKMSTTGQDPCWLRTEVLESNNSLGIYKETDFPTYTVEVDFANPGFAANEMAEIVTAVEEECPIGKHFGVSGIGEGVVFSKFNYDTGSRIVFKVKGQKHSVSKVKTLAPVDIEKVKSINAFVEYSVTVARLEQGATEVLDSDFDRKNLGKFIKWVSSDVIKEESDVLEGNDLTMADVGRKLSEVAKTWFFEQEKI